MVRQPGRGGHVGVRAVPADWVGAVNHWVNTTTEQVQRGIELGDRLLMVRYEDLVTRPGDRRCARCSSGSTSPGRTACSSTTRCTPSAARRRRSRAPPARTSRSRPTGSRRGPSTSDPEDLAVLTEKAGRARRASSATTSRTPTALAPTGRRRLAAEKTLTGDDLARAQRAFPELAAEFDRRDVPWAGNRMLTPDAVGIIQGAGRKAKAAKKTAKKAPPKPPATKTEAVAAQARKAARRVRRLARRLRAQLTRR